MKIAFGNDHAGPGMKEELIKYLESKGHTVVNVGTDTKDSCDYSDYGLAAAKKVASGECDCGVLVCGTGIGISISANKVKGIRAAVVSDPTSARLTRQHNNANMIAFGSRIVGIETAKMILDYFLETEYEGNKPGGERHQKRVEKMMAIEEM